MELRITRTKTKLFLVFVTILLGVIHGSYELETTSSLIGKLEKSLFSKLGMTGRPVVDPRKRNRIPPAMIDLYQQQMNNEYESTALPLPGKLTRYANTVRSYTHQESSIDDRFTHSHRFRLNFDLTGFPTETEMVTSTELRLSIVPKEVNHISNTQRVNVYDIVAPGIKGKSKPILRIVDTAVVNTTCEEASCSISVDVLPMVERWLSQSSGNHGLLIDVRSLTGDKVESSHVRLKRALQEDDKEQWHALQPLLLVYSADSAAQKVASSTNNTLRWNDDSKRRKRSSPTRKRLRDECRRRQLWVDFEKVGWNDWIVAPPGYEAYFCAGECPTQFADHLNTTNHAIVQSLVHSVHPRTIPKACCVPTTLTSISMLYLDEHNKAVLKNYPDMVVEGCGCR